MWMFTKNGFVSIRKKGGTDNLEVRSRAKAELEALISRHGLDSEIIETPHADYRWRIILDPGKFAAVMVAEVLAIDYDNFKSAVSRNSSGKHLFEVWAAVKDWYEGLEDIPHESQLDQDWHSEESYAD